MVVASRKTPREVPGLGIIKLIWHTGILFTKLVTTEKEPMMDVKERLKPVSHVFFQDVRFNFAFLVRPAPPLWNIRSTRKSSKGCLLLKWAAARFLRSIKSQASSKKSNQNHIYSMQPGLLNSCCSWLAALPFGVSISLRVDVVAVVYAGWFILLPECWQTANTVTSATQIRTIISECNFIFRLVLLCWICTPNPAQRAQHGQIPGPTQPSAPTSVFSLFFSKIEPHR